jgi:osmotically-inducible protein OsmY
LESPIPGDEVARVTAAAAMRIRELWKEVESLRADREHFRQSGSTLADDLRAAQERTDDSKTRFLLGRAADEIEMLRRKHKHTVSVYQGKVRYLGERLEACKADLEQLRQSGND